MNTIHATNRVNELELESVTIPPPLSPPTHMHRFPCIMLLSQGISSEASWHAKFANSSYIYAGGFAYELTEGDIIAVFSQFGEVASRFHSSSHSTSHLLCRSAADCRHQPVPRPQNGKVQRFLLFAVRRPAQHCFGG